MNKMLFILVRVCFKAVEEELPKEVHDFYRATIAKAISLSDKYERRCG